MKKWFISTCLFVLLRPALAFSNDATILKTRLNQVGSFHAHFIQRVSSAEGYTVQDGKGELWVKKQNRFNWHMTSPDESVLLSDGTNLWFYNPLIEQATVNWLNTSTSNTPFMLITQNDTTNWHQYNVAQDGDSFSLVPKSNLRNLNRFTIRVTPNGTIKGFTTLEQDGQYSTYELKNHNNEKVEEAKFHFKLPKGVTLDDQRQ